MFSKKSKILICTVSLLLIFLGYTATSAKTSDPCSCSIQDISNTLSSLSNDSAKKYVSQSKLLLDDGVNCLRSACVQPTGYLTKNTNEAINFCSQGKYGCSNEAVEMCGPGPQNHASPYTIQMGDYCLLCQIAANMDNNGKTIDPDNNNPLSLSDTKVQEAFGNAERGVTTIKQGSENIKNINERLKSLPVIGWVFQGIEFLGSVAHTVLDLINGNFGDILKGIANFFIGIIKVLSGILIWAINPQTYGGMSTNGGVIAVWNFMREIANIIIVLGVVIIAIATILRIQPYNAKSLLWKLIIIALLVNFSLVLTGMVVDVFNFLSVYFINLGVNQNQGMDQTISSSFGYDKMVTSMADPKPSGGTAWDTDPQMGLGTFLVIAFILIVAGITSVIAIFAGFVSLLIRAFVIFFCLAVSPFVFASWIFPATQRYWKMWWTQLIKWLSFSVIFSVMLYLGISIMQAGPISSIGGGGGNVGFISGIIQTILFSVFLVGGLLFALQGGSAVSQKVMSGGGKLVQSVGAWAGKTSIQAMARSQNYQNIANRLATNTRPILNRLGVNRLGASMLRNSSNVLASQGRRIDQGIEPIRENENALRAGFSSTNNSLQKLKYLGALVDGGNNLNSSEITQYLSFAHLYKGSPEVRKIEKAIPSLKDNGSITNTDLVQRLTASYQNADSKIMGSSLINDILTRRPGEFDAIIGTLIRNMKDVRSLNNFILSMSPGDRSQLCERISVALGGNPSLDAWLQVPSNNPDLYRQIQNPDSSRAPVVPTIKQFFNIP